MSDREPLKEKKVNWYIFIWVIGFILIIFGFVFNEIKGVSEVKLDVRELKTDMKWIINELQEYKEANGGVLNFYEIMNDKKL